MRGSIFRREALEHHRLARQEGDVLRISPAWSRPAYWLLVAVLGVALVFCAVGTVYGYAAGPALVRLEGRTELVVDTAGVVSSVEVRPGQRVEAGQVLVRFLSEEEGRALERLERELELQLVRWLKEPTDAAARQALSSVRAEQELARARLEARALRAPHAGVVGDVRLQPGQYLTPGASALTLVDDAAQVSLEAYLPGASRPFLQPGTPLRVELEGFEYEYRELVVESVGDEVIGPSEVRRHLGPELADAVPVAGPVVLVKARLPARSFQHQGRSFNYFDGMPAKAEARVRVQSILLLLVPGLKGLLPHDG
jgi:membrane fusion protein (multidrug efflux system)